LKNAAGRIDVVEYIAGSMEEMEPRTLKILQRFHAALSLPLFTSSLVTHDPLAASRDQAEAMEPEGAMEAAE
jgi:hypothetical protein